MSEKVLCVDDDPNLLSSLKRQLQERFQIETAQSGIEALEKIDSQEPFAVVLADIRMPGMNGIQFLSRVKKRSPDTVRMILTGNADLQTVINSVNESNVFRFLTKPCAQEDLTASIRAGVTQYQLVTAEKELASKSLVGVVGILTEALSLARPNAFRHLSRITHYVKRIVSQLRLPDPWQYELAAMLSHTGCIALPSRILEKIYSGQPLLLKEQQMYLSHSLVGARLVANIPCLEPVVHMIEKQQKWFNEYPPLEKMTQDGMTSLGAQILKVATDFDRIRSRGFSRGVALSSLRQQPTEYNLNVVEALARARIDEDQLQDQDFINNENRVEVIDTDWPERAIENSSSANVDVFGKILCVDSEPNLLSIYKRYLHSRFQIEMAQSGVEGLEVMDSLGPFAVVVADINLLDMDGVQFMSRIRERFPNTVRMILTENADLQEAIKAINDGSVFRFLTKPCTPEALGRSLNAALKQHKRITANHEVLSKMLLGSVKLMTHILGLANHIAVNRTSHITRYVKQIAARLRLPNLWQFELAARLSHVGCIVMPPIILAKLDAGESLSPDEYEAYLSHPSIGASLVSGIPRLEPIAAIIREQQKPFKDYPILDDTSEEVMVYLGAQTLKIATLVDQMLASGCIYEDVLSELRTHPDEYSPEVVAAFESLHIGSVMGKIPSSDQRVSDDDRPEETGQTAKERSATPAPWQPVIQSLDPSLAEAVTEFLERDEFVDSMYSEFGEAESDDREIEADDVFAQENIQTRDGTVLLSEGEKMSPLMQSILERLSDFFNVEERKAEDGTSLPTDEYRTSPFESNIAKRLRRFFQARESEPEKINERLKRIDQENSGTDIIVERDIKIRDGSLLLAKGQRVSPLMYLALEDISNFLQKANYALGESGHEAESDHSEVLDRESGEPDQADVPHEEPSAAKPTEVDTLQDGTQPEPQRIRRRKTRNADEQTKLIRLVHLRPGMVVDEDVKTSDGILLLAKGQKVTAHNLQRLINFHMIVGLADTEFLIMKTSIPDI